MPECPFELLIEDVSLKEAHSVVCLSIIRSVAGKRAVYDATCDGKAVIIKVFLDKISANRHFKREWKGLCGLQELGINSPKPLFFGKTPSGDLAMVIEKIIDAPVAMDVYLQADLTKKSQLLSMVCDQLSLQHDKGILQKDLHLGNFLLQQNKLFVIDPAQIRFCNKPIGRKQALKQLAIFGASICEETIDFIKNFCNCYAAKRNWQFTESEISALSKKILVYKNYEIRKGLKKCLYTNKRYMKLLRQSCFAIGQKDFLEKIDSDFFFKNIDEMMLSGKILKNGNTCFVSQINFGGKDIVIKRYNYKGLVHSFRHTMKRSRARRNWLHAHRLLMLGIATAKPLAFIEKRSGLIIKKSYFIAEFVEGQKLDDFLKDKTVFKEQRSKIVTSIGKLLDTLKNHRITHGDLKHSNILINNDIPTLIDLDSMQVHYCKWLFNMKNKDQVTIEP